MQRDELVRYLDEYLGIAAIKDFGPQGLQVEGRSDVHKIVGMVDAHLPCVEAALDRGADLLLVHHGVFWGEARLLRGALGRIVRAIVRADLNLYAAHLALDGHPAVGNNVELAKRLGLNVVEWWAKVNGVNIGVIGQAEEGIRFDEVMERFRANVGAPVLVQAHGAATVRRMAIVSGGAAGEIGSAAALGCDTVLTGETSHAHFYDAQEFGVNVIYGGHYTTETVGVQALGSHLSERFGVAFEFVDLPTGV